MRNLLAAFLVLSAAPAFAKGTPPAKPADKPAEKPAAAPPAATPPAGPSATAELKDLKGQKVGDALLEETPHGVLMTITLTGAPAGIHAIHIHETGKCEPPFKTAGGHLNPGGKHHGIKNPEGKHEGDLPNIDVPADGKLEVQILAGAATLKKGEKNTMLDADGASIVIHAKQDDHMSDPAGNAGDRIICGVVTEKK
jgi:Cu-Zn family superoxide dismutase